MLLIPTSVKAVADVAEKRENARFATAAVQVRAGGDGYEVAATDTKRLIRVRSGHMDAPTEYPACPALDAAPNGAKAALVPAGVFKDVFARAGRLTRAARRGSKPILANVAAVLGTQVATFGATDLARTQVEEVRVAVGHFPPCDAIFPGGEPVAKVRLDVDLLVGLLKAMKDASGGTDVAVTVEVRAGGMPRWCCGPTARTGTGSRPRSTGC